MKVTINIINTCCITMSGAVIMPSLRMMTSTVFEEWLARSTHTDRQTDRLWVVYVKSCKVFAKNKQKNSDYGRFVIDINTSECFGMIAAKRFVLSAMAPGQNDTSVVAQLVHYGRNLCRVLTKGVLSRWGQYELLAKECGTITTSST